MNIVISNSSGKPIYEQISVQMKDQILSGALAPGDPLPSMRLLAKELRISVITTKRAYNDLEQEGFIETVTGKGSFVAAGNRELLREAKLRQIEEMLESAVDAAKSGGIGLAELIETLTLLFEGESS
ncbi:GntR family transcriptional regulator [Oscillospiraceae bacterium OttesenSCG-928-G22]|nr:GntR family transcriptional regulator [Oscillospiraceae bacterium OttesenSCG-928-G22]